MTMSYATCTMNDVIAKSYLMHPSLFADTLQAAANVHGDYAGRTYSKQASTIASGMCHDAASVKRMINKGTLDPEALTFSQRIIAFHEAWKLQCITHGVAKDIVARS